MDNRLKGQHQESVELRLLKQSDCGWSGQLVRRIMVQNINILYY